jgi:ubiquinone/menaquinone biosynthesis C-methylase UbiE
MEIEPGMTAVDLGAGTGYFLGHLSRAVGEAGRVLALDVEENLVEFMKDRAEREGWANVGPRRVPYDDPELADGSVDRVLVVDTWHHVEDRGAYAAKLYRALAPGGRVYVVDITKDSPTGPPVEHRLAPEQVIAELAEGGLEVEVLEEPLPRQFIVVGRRPEALE